MIWFIQRLPNKRSREATKVIKTPAAMQAFLFWHAGSAGLRACTKNLRLESGLLNFHLSVEALPGLAPAGHLLFCFAKKVGKKGDPVAFAPAGFPNAQAAEREVQKLAFGSDICTSYPLCSLRIWRRQKGKFNTLFESAEPVLFAATSRRMNPSPAGGRGTG